MILLLLSAVVFPQATNAKERTPAAPTYRVFATREGLVGHRTANGHIITPRDRFVALPSWKALSPKGTNNFQVRVTYHGRSAVLPVWDVGPWNTNDEYWSPNRVYSDLPVGKPMAQAAYQDGYNGGKDAWGRRIQAPNGIDIADGAFWDDLGMRDSDWVEVTFLWMGDTAPAAAPRIAPPAQPEQIAVEQGAIVVDDNGEGYQPSDDRWYDAPCGLNGRSSWTYGASKADSTHEAVWQPQLPGAGTYEVLAYVPACGQPATTNARYHISRGDTVTTVPVNQAANAGKWVSLGTYHLDNGAQVILSDYTNDEGGVRFDAVKLVPRVDNAAPQAAATAATPQGDGAFLIQWAGTDDGSGLASYDVQVRIVPDGGWTDWQIGVAAEQATFVPPGPGSYGVRVRATDWAGNKQPWRDGDDLVFTAP